MSNDQKPVLYEFVGSTWANVPKIAIEEAGFKEGDFEYKSINLAEGENFNPEYLKLNPNGTVPTLVSKGETYVDSTVSGRALWALQGCRLTHRFPRPLSILAVPHPSCPLFQRSFPTIFLLPMPSPNAMISPPRRAMPFTRQTVVPAILKLAPHPPRVSAHTSTSIIEEIHAAAHDSNATFLMSIDDEDRQSKIKGGQKDFLQGRQNALDKYAPDAPEEFKTFLAKKQAGNKSLLEFYTQEPDAAAKSAHYEQTAELWKSVGIVIRGVITQALTKNGGPYAAGEQPSEVDFHIITWLARTISNTGVEQGASAAEALPVLQKRTGGHGFDPVLGKYWDAWTQRESYKKIKLH
ncbi:hypothetical protein P7C73_g2777, partial [Tremellales sp. Uapishka_1]